MKTESVIKSAVGFFLVILLGSLVSAALGGAFTATAAVISPECASVFFGKSVKSAGNGIENMIKIAREFKKLTTLPIIIQSNAGIPEMNLY